MWFVLVCAPAQHLTEPREGMVLGDGTHR